MIIDEIRASRAPHEHEEDSKAVNEYAGFGAAVTIPPLHENEEGENLESASQPQQLQNPGSDYTNVGAAKGVTVGKAPGLADLRGQQHTTSRDTAADAPSPTPSPKKPTTNKGPAHAFKTRVAPATAAEPTAM